jgi:hypothetical protein
MANINVEQVLKKLTVSEKVDLLAGELADRGRTYREDVDGSTNMSYNRN